MPTINSISCSSLTDLSFQSVQWTECLLNSLANEDLDIVLRGAVIVKNLVSSCKEVAEKVLETQLMECMQAHIFKAKCKLASSDCITQWKNVT